jgi:esterase
MSYLENFHHQITGNPAGHKLVFLHGLMGSASNWRRIIPAFEGDFRILAYDQRGHGRSFQPPTGYQPRDYAEDLKRILDELGWAKTALVGHSMGGRNALEFASLFSQRVNALILEDIGPEASSQAVRHIERLIELVPTPFVSREEAKEFFDHRYPALIPFYPKAEVVARFLFTNMENKPQGGVDWRFSKSAILQSLREGRREDRWDALRRLKMPVLIIRGENSMDLAPETFARMQTILPLAQGVEIPDAGHWVHFDQPDIFIRVLKDFLTCLSASVY